MKIRWVLFFFTFLFFVMACQTGTNQKSDDKNTSGLSVSEMENYKKRGSEIASATFSALSGKLQNAMKEGGVANAVQYCNLAAMPIVDSLSKVHHAQIRRTSLKVRNSKNAPTPAELGVLKDFQNKAEKEETISPLVKEIGKNKIAFYAPIHLAPLCQKCHGKIGETLLAEDYKLIKKLYPEDEAISYESGDLRGMWSIEFEK